MLRASCRWLGTCVPDRYVHFRQELCKRKGDGHLEVGTLRRLRQFLMCGCGHESERLLETGTGGIWHDGLAF